MKKNETTGHWLLRVFRRNFLAGILIMVPLAIAVWLLWWLFSSVDNLLQPIIEAIFGREIPGLGFAIFLVLTYIIGVIASNYIGKKAIRSAESLLTRVPVFRQIYIGAKQVVEGLSGAGINKAAFREVVFVEFPRDGMTTLAFITNEVINKSGKKLYAIYIPTAPVPSSGYFEMVTEEKITHTDIPVDEGIKMVISSGMILPDKVTVGKPPVKAPKSIVDIFVSTPEPETSPDDKHD
ncbi:MAG TPA: DUF502 domain-containing protein [Dehalococcoidia bacterium]|nr:DUF502 domain-containing protein [Dehalococcoidia bacterium]